MSFYQESFEHLLVQKNNHLLWVTLDNPSMSNAITYEMIDSLTRVLNFADQDSDIRVIILTGNGKNFCAGGDIKAMEAKEGMFAGDSFELRNLYSHGIQNIPRIIERIQKPIIGMINGAAIGAGCDLAAMCDLRVASTRAKFGETFTKLSLVPGDGGPYFLARVIGYTKAMEMYLTGKIYSAEEVNSMGLLNDLVEESDLKSTTEKLALLIANNAPSAVQFTKTAMKRAMKDDLESHLNLLSAYQGISQRTQDHFEALDAFKNKRSPEFKGK